MFKRHKKCKALAIYHIESRGQKMRLKYIELGMRELLVFPSFKCQGRSWRVIVLSGWLENRDHAWTAGSILAGRLYFHPFLVSSAHPWHFSLPLSLPPLCQFIKVVTLLSLQSESECAPGKEWRKSQQELSFSATVYSTVACSYWNFIHGFVWLLQ